uniref:DEK-C domain-containing protein n=1 Tax=Oryzias melastigma TaxID=30732 RepID=A0A3B3BDM3_ORYME
MIWNKQNQRFESGRSRPRGRTRVLLVLLIPAQLARLCNSDVITCSTCGTMGSSVPSEEDHEEAGPDRSGSTESSGGGGVLQGKRAKKTVERLDLQAPKQKEKLRMGDGAGDKLGDIPRTSYQINRMKAADLKPLHSILYDRPGKVSTMKRNLRLFNGFPFQADSEQFHRKRDKLLKSSSLSNSKLKLVCTVLDLEKKGTHSDLIHRILGFLLSPKNSGKRLPVKKRRRSKKKLTGEDSKKKSRPRERSSCTPKKSRTRSKSSAIVMDSSSDDEDEKTAAAAAQSDGEDEEERRSETSEDEEQSSRSESDRAKKKTATSQETPTKKKRMKKRSLEELQPRKKKAAPLRPAAKVKKADSSRASNTAADSSDDDQPLIKMMKTSVSDEKLKETLQTLLRDADLGEMTMKKICQQVFDMFPEHDLSSRKDFIKQTVKDIIT